MTRSAALSRIPALVLALLPSACGGDSAAPPEPVKDGSSSLCGPAGGGDGAGTAGGRDSHFPLIDGATWTYHHTNPNKPEWDEVATLKATSCDGKPAFLFEDEEDAQGLQTHSTLVAKGSRVLRVYREVTTGGQAALRVTYVPGFVRFDEAWTAEGQAVTVDDQTAQDCLVPNVVKGCDVVGAQTPGTSTHTFTVLKASTPVTVLAGTFDAVQIQRVNVSSGEQKLYWFAAGVGKVREESPAAQAVEELSSYEIP